MSKREWKPGDVAMVTIYRDEHVAVRQWDGWATAYGQTDSEPQLAEVTAARPLVVIDPEDREQVERLMETYRSQPGWFAGGQRQTEDCMQAALREFANPTPPRPDEPTGLGAVVVDGSGFTYTRFSHSEEHSEGDWINEDGARFQWADVPAVRVLSEGVQP